MLHMRLKQRILCYSSVCILLLLIGKILFPSNDCKKDTDLKPHKHEHDPWNLNEHNIEYEVYKAINKLRRTSNSQLKPIDEPAVDKAVMKTG